MLKKVFCFLFFVILIGGCNTPKIELSFAQVFSNHMVLQQDQVNAIWGTATPNIKITLTSSWGEKILTKSDALGNWILYLPTPPYDKNPPSDSYTIDVTEITSLIELLEAGISVYPNPFSPSITSSGVTFGFSLTQLFHVVAKRSAETA